MLKGLQAMAAQHRRRTPLQRSIFALTLLVVLAGVGFTTGWNVVTRTNQSAGLQPFDGADPRGTDGEQALNFPSLPQLSREDAAASAESSDRETAEASQQAESIVFDPAETVQRVEAPPAQLPPVRVERQADDRGFQPKVDAMPPEQMSVISPPNESNAIDVAEVLENADDLVWPVSGSISRPFGWYRHPVFGDWRHDASVALIPEEGEQTVRATLAGRVRDVVREGGLWRVSIEHDGGLRSEYEGLRSVDVASFTEVTTGSVIGEAPDPESGRVVGFTLISDGSPIDPQTLIGGESLPVLAP